MANALGQATNFFGSQFEPDSIRTKDSEVTLEEIKLSTQKALRSARDTYKRGSRIHDGMSTTLRHLDKDLTAFFSWLSCLFHEVHACKLCSELKFVSVHVEYLSDTVFAGAIRTILSVCYCDSEANSIGVTDC